VSLHLSGVNIVEPDENLARKHSLRVEQTLVATADRVEPDASTITGSISGTVETETGAYITVDVTLTATSSAVEANGRITCNGETILDRRWRG
jgi:hypothetical protein